MSYFIFLSARIKKTSESKSVPNGIQLALNQDDIHRLDEVRQSVEEKKLSSANIPSVGNVIVFDFNNPDTDFDDVSGKCQICVTEEGIQTVMETDDDGYAWADFTWAEVRESIATATSLS